MKQQKKLYQSWEYKATPGKREKPWWKIKKTIQDEDTTQHHKRSKNLDETTKKNIKTKNTKQHQQRRKNLNEATKKSIQGKDTKYPR